MRYTINEPLVIADVIGDEVIILNLDTGTYFSAQKTGLDIWRLLASGHTVTEVVNVVSEHYSVVASELEPRVEELLKLFLDKSLLRTADIAEPAEQVALEGDGRPYSQPEVTTYTDMQDLLLIDPIHEVEDLGWPHKKETE